MAESPKTEMIDVGKLTGGDSLEVTLVVALPGAPEKRYPMRTNEMKVGRSDQTDIAVKEASISSKHCEFARDGGQLYVKDLGSSNGTFLNGERVQESELHNGDVIRLGNSATITVQMGSGAAPRRAPAGPPNNEVAGSTQMISANDLNAMRAPMAPPPRSAPSPRAPPPMAAMKYDDPAERSGGSKGLIIGLVVGGVVLVLAVVGVLVLFAGRSAAADRVILSDVQKESTTINAATPCVAVQDSVSTLIRLEQAAGVQAPTLPQRRGDSRASVEKFIDVQRDKARQYKRIIGTVEQLSMSTQVTVDRIKSDIAKINDEALKAKTAEISAALDERMQATQDFIGGWRRLQTETDRFADLIDTVFIKGSSTAEADQYREFRFSKQAPQVLAACRSAHESAKKNIEAKVAALSAATAP